MGFHRGNFFSRGKIEVRTMVLEDFFTLEIRAADFVSENISENSDVRTVCTQTVAANS